MNTIGHIGRTLRAEASRVLRPSRLAWAHPHNELQQSVYVTPLPHGLEIEVQIYPGVLVADAFVAALDSDGDGVISDAEAQAHIEGLIRNSITVRSHGVDLPLRIARFVYPPAEELRQSAAAVSFVLTADVPGRDEEREVTVTYTNEPPHSTIQMNVTLSTREPMTVTHIDRDADGRGVTVRYATPLAVA